MPADRVDAPPALAAQPEETVEQEDRAENVPSPSGESGGKTLRGGHDAREMSRQAVDARRRYALSRQQAETPSAGLRLVALAQYEIATGPKTIPAAARTAAARAYADLIVAAEQAAEREGERGDGVDWDAMSPARRTLIRLVLDATVEDVERWLAALEGEERAGAPAEEEVQAG